jgi:hypothetical protein
MAFPASMLATVNPILNSSPSIVATAIAKLPAAPTFLALNAIGVNSGSSTSLANPIIGVNGNSAARGENQTPTALLSIYSEILAMASAVYRI